MLLNQGLRASSTPVQVSYSTTTILSDNTSTATPSFAGVNFGTAYVDRYAIVFVVKQITTSSADLTSATIGGINATILANQSTQNSGTGVAAIIGAYLPTGTTATVALTFAATSSSCAILPMALTGVQKRIDSAIVGITTGTVMTVNNDDVLNGITLGVACNDNNATFTWTGLTELVDAAFTGGGSSRRIGVAYLNPTVTSLNKTITATNSSSVTRGALAVASLR